MKMNGPSPVRNKRDSGESLQLIIASDEIIPSTPYRKSVDCNHGEPCFILVERMILIYWFPPYQRSKQDRRRVGDVQQAWGD